MSDRPHTPMDYYSTHYMNMKNAVIKAERRILKELGFCVHVKHPHKLIITYLQMIGFSGNVELARKAWNYMNDSLRCDVFVRFTPEVIACACIFLAARVVKINLPIKPPWWELFDVSYDDIEDIALSILRLYERPKRKITQLEATVSKLKKSLTDKKVNKVDSPAAGSGSFTPAHSSTATPSTTNTTATTNTNNNGSASINNNSSKPTSKTGSPVEKQSTLTSVVARTSDHKRDTKHNSSDDHRRRHHNNHHSNHPSESESSEYSSDSEEELPSKKYSRQREQYNNRRKRSPSSGSDNARRTYASKDRNSVSPHDDYRKNNVKDRLHKDGYRDKVDRNSDYKHRRRSRSRSPVKRYRSPSPSRSKDKLREKERQRAKEKYYDNKYVKMRR